MTLSFSEENVWKLCHYVSERAPNDLDPFFVLFISNDAQKVHVARMSLRKHRLHFEISLTAFLSVYPVTDSSLETKSWRGRGRSSGDLGLPRHPDP